MQSGKEQMTQVSANSPTDINKERSMSISLSKGQRVDLTKGRPSLKNIFVGLV